MTFRDTAWPEGTPCWVEVRVFDPKHTSEFYGALFGWEFLDRGEEYDHYLTASLAGRTVADIGPRFEEPAGAPSAWLVCIAVESTDAVAERIVRAGGTLTVEPTDVGTHGRFAVAADPGGAVFGIWQADEYFGAEVADVPGAAVWHRCLTRDHAAAQAFYVEVFGYTVTPEPDGPGGPGGGPDAAAGVVLRLDGRPVAGLAEAGAGAASHWLVTFGVAEVATAIKKVTASGGSVVTGPYDTPRGPSVLVADEQGTPFEVVAVGAAT
ncbi:VOC family protein [Embleya sp. NPDC056575]|uniref:VOC family protein n=1 Tax=unclassified Embleya TaxID=2699296 RepID=UPI0036A481ED